MRIESSTIRRPWSHVLRAHTSRAGGAADAPAAGVPAAAQHAQDLGTAVLEVPSGGASPLAKAGSAIIALLTSLPFGSAAAAMLLCARHSQATGEMGCGRRQPDNHAWRQSFALGCVAFFDHTLCGGVSWVVCPEEIRSVTSAFPIPVTVARW